MELFKVVDRLVDLPHVVKTDGDLCRDVGRVLQSPVGQPEVDLQGLVVELQLQVGVGQEQVFYPVVRQGQLLQLVPAGHETGQLQPGAPVTRFARDALAQHGHGQLLEHGT